MTIYSRVTEVVIVITTIVMITNVFCADRRYFNTKEELELTRSEPRIDGKACKANDRLAIFVLSGARFNGRFFDQRQAVRKTWAKLAKEQYNISTYFAIALNANEDINYEIQVEADKHQDIIQFSFIDAYYNLTLKSVSILRWVSRKCRHLKYMLKADSDVIINIELLDLTLDQFKSGCTGRGDVEKPHRTNHKNSVPVKYFPKDTYPRFVYGGAYVVSTDVIDKLLDTIDSYTDYVLDIEDVFITGIIAEKAGVARYWDSRFADFYDDCRINRKNLCRMCSLIAMVECNDTPNMLQFYHEWQQFDCHCTSILLLILSIFLIIIFIIVLVFVILVFLYNKNKTSQRNRH